MSKFKDPLNTTQAAEREKIEVVPSKPCQTAEDLSLAYTPGVALPCLEIQKILTMPTNIHPKETWLQLSPTVRRYWAWQIK